MIMYTSIVMIIASYDVCIHGCMYNIRWFIVYIEQLIAQIADLKKEIITLETKLKESISSNSSANSKLLDELKSLKKQLVERSAEYIKEKTDKEAAHKTALEVLKDKQLTDVSNLERKLKQAADLAKSVAVEYDTASTAAEKKFEARMSEVQAKHSTAVETMQKENGKTLEALGQQITEMELQFKELSNTGDYERTGLKADVAKLDDKCKSLQKNLDAKLKENERNDGVCSGLKTQIERCVCGELLLNATRSE